MIQLHNVSKTYYRGTEPLYILKDISLCVNKGEFVAIMGPSGSGKSTLMNILGCLDTVDAGIYEMAGCRIDKMALSELARIRNCQFGFVFQLFNLIPRLSALRNVELPMIYSRIPPDDRRERAMGALVRVGLGERCDHLPSQLSGGQQQRVAIARAIVNDPDVIIADEPTGSLDTASGEAVMNLFGELHMQGKTIIMVTHENDIAAHAERIIRVRDGYIEKGDD